MRANQRKYKRITWNRHGEIFSLLGRKIATCAIKDISANGARLEVDTTEKLPDCFRLHFGAREHPKCSVRWRNGNEIGVQFLLRSMYIHEAWLGWASRFTSSNNLP
jgi:hypothetical protein